MASEGVSGAAAAEPQDKASLLRRIDETRARYEAALAAISDPLAPLRADGWSAKDIAGHVAVWERRLTRDIEARLRGETLERPEPGYTWEQMDALNVSDMEASRALPLAAVMAESRAAFAAARALVASLSEERLFTPGVFPDAETDPTDLTDSTDPTDPLALWVRGDMWEHYEEHAADLEARAEQAE
jgi:hypothetical protein